MKFCNFLSFCFFGLYHIWSLLIWNAGHFSLRENLCLYREGRGQDSMTRTSTYMYNIFYNHLSCCTLWRWQKATACVLVLILGFFLKLMWRRQKILYLDPEKIKFSKEAELSPPPPLLPPLLSLGKLFTEPSRGVSPLPQQKSYYCRTRGKIGRKLGPKSSFCTLPYWWYLHSAWCVSPTWMQREWWEEACELYRALSQLI